MKPEYSPDAVSPPGDTLRELIEHRGISPYTLAHAMGVSPRTVRGILDGSTRITEAIALKLEDATRVPAGFWLNRERNYRGGL